MSSTLSGAAPRPGRRRSWVGRLCLALGVAGAIGGTFGHGGVASAYEACRSDPVLVVNGAIVDVVSTLQTNPGSIRELDYTVTVPTGSLIGKTALTVGIGFPEVVTYVFSNQQPWGTMSIAATVQTQAGTAPFPTAVQASSLLYSNTASGYSNSTVTVRLEHQLMLGL